MFDAMGEGATRKYVVSWNDSPLSIQKGANKTPFLGYNISRRKRGTHE
jgi:hypothetical protein